MVVAVVALIAAPLHFLSTNGNIRKSVVVVIKTLNLIVQEATIKLIIKRSIHYCTNIYTIYNIYIHMYVYETTYNNNNNVANFFFVYLT